MYIRLTKKEAKRRGRQGKRGGRGGTRNDSTGHVRGRILFGGVRGGKASFSFT